MVTMSPRHVSRHEAFIATLAHEFRQPLSALTAAVEIIGVAPSPEAAEWAIGTIQRQTRQLSRIVEDLMDAARWTAGKAILRTRRVDICQAVREAAHDAASSVVARRHVLSIDTPGRPLWVEGDPIRLQQVLSNLLSNAIKFTDPGGRISVTATFSASSVSVCVSDTGRGLEPQVLDYVFDLFSQVRPAEDVGMGIGLSVVKGIVEQHGGRIEARSEGLGCGASFIVTLPIARAVESVAS